MIYKSFLLEENINNLKNKVILFYGENLGLKNDFKKVLKHKNRENEVISFNQEQIIKNSNALLNEVSNISLFEKKKIFFINDASDKILEILKDVIKDFDDQEIYLFSNLLDKRSKLRNFFEKEKLCGIVPCYVDNEIALKKVIMRRLNGFEGLTALNINLILKHVGFDRAKLNNELDKIIVYFDKKKIITEKLNELLDPISNDDYNLLRDTALAGNKNKTNDLLSETYFETDKNIFYLNIINQRLNRLWEINKAEKGKNLDEKINNLKPPIFWKDKINFVNQTKIWNNKKIKAILEKTYNIEKKIKSNSVINKNILLKKLILDICECANS